MSELISDLGTFDMPTQRDMERYAGMFYLYKQFGLRIGKTRVCEACEKRFRITRENEILCPDHANEDWDELLTELKVKAGLKLLFG